MFYFFFMPRKKHILDRGSVLARNRNQIVINDRKSLLTNLLGHFSLDRSNEEAEIFKDEGRVSNQFCY